MNQGLLARVNKERMHRTTGERSSHREIDKSEMDVLGYGNTVFVC